MASCLTPRAGRCMCDLGYIVMAYMVMAYEVMACIVMAYTLMACMVMASCLTTRAGRSMCNLGARRIGARSCASAARGTRPSAPNSFSLSAPKTFFKRYLEACRR